MFLRASVVAGTTAALLALTGGGTAHASCLDDAQASNIQAGYTPQPKSPYWPWPDYYVQQSGTATFTVHGDALISDSSGFVASDVPELATVVSGNTVTITTTFVDCVAG